MPLIAGIALMIVLVPAAEALACACGCAVFDVGSNALLPKEGDHGGAVYFEWDYSNQNTNWSGTSKAPAANNGNKDILTNWFVVGLNYMVSRDWGFNVRMPTANRSFLNDNNFPEDPGQPTDIQKYLVSTIGDVELTGMYTGLSDDMSKGIIFGLKLPTGNWRAYGFDRDTQIGTGSTDLILGGFWRGMITGDNAWQYFVQARMLAPIATHSEYIPTFGSDAGDYIPGIQFDAAAGVFYNNWYHVGPLDKIAPVLQLIYSHREPDSGAAADPANTGYDRLYISPGGRYHQGGGRSQQQDVQALRRYRDSDLSKGERQSARLALLVQACPRLYILTVNRAPRHQAAWRALFAAAFLFSSALLPAASAELGLQTRAPALAVPLADGRDFDLDAMRGKVVLVAFWATWCAPCLEEMPAIEKYYREHKADGFEVIALSIDKPASRAKAFRVLATLSFPGAMASDARVNGFGTPEAVPVSYLVDAEGMLRDKFVSIDEGLLDEVVTPLLKKKRAAPIPAGMRR